MKKVLVIGFSFMILLCIIFKLKNNKLKCEYKVDYDDIKIVNKIEFNFKNKKYKQVDKMTFADVETARSYLEDIKDYIDVYNLKLDGKTIVSEIEDTIENDVNKKDLKSKYEGYNYTCR